MIMSLLLGGFVLEDGKAPKEPTFSPTTEVLIHKNLAIVDCILLEDPINVAFGLLDMAL